MLLEETDYVVFIVCYTEAGGSLWAQDLTVKGIGSKRLPSIYKDTQIQRRL